MRVTDPELTEEKLYLFNEGNYFHSYRIFGSHPVKDGIRFTVWCPDVKSVAVIGTFSSWDPIALSAQGKTGVWSGVIPVAKVGDLYKYHIVPLKGKAFDKADPYAFAAEVRPGTASRICDLDTYAWRDGRWRSSHRSRKTPRPMNIYEVHLGSWKQQRNPKDISLPFLTYRQLADDLIPYTVRMGYTHIEIMPVMEHPLDTSWGYQLTGYFAATSRYGSPQDFMYLVDRAHRAGIGVILDWVPGHFCRDAHGLARFNGKRLFESVDHPTWGTSKFNFEKKEVRSFLFSSAIFWLTVFHADGLRVDGVTSMLYLNFDVNDPAQKRYNAAGGEEDPSAIQFIQNFTTTIHEYAPSALLIAEESTAWPQVTGPVENGGLGFDYKWDMGWMNDTLNYFRTDFPYRKKEHGKLTFSLTYAFSERFILPLSHDEVVHGKASLMGRMPGSYEEKFAGLRLLALWQLTHPGGKLSFMSTEYGPFIEWREYESLEWFLLDYPSHRKHQDFTAALNHLYTRTPALWQNDHDWNGFHWLDPNDSAQSILLYRRIGSPRSKSVTVILNLVPTDYPEFRIGVPQAGTYRELFTTDRNDFGGSGIENRNTILADAISAHGEKWSVVIHLPPLTGILLQRVDDENKK